MTRMMLSSVVKSGKMSGWGRGPMTRAVGLSNQVWQREFLEDVTDDSHSHGAELRSQVW